MRRRCPLGVLMVDARAAQGLTLRAFADRADLSVSYLSDVERGRRVPAVETLERLMVLLLVPPADRDPWYAAADVLAPGLMDALLAHPERWGAVREVLAAVDLCGNCRVPRPPGAAWVPVTAPWAPEPLRLCPGCEMRGKVSGVIVPKGGG